MSGRRAGLVITSIFPNATEPARGMFVLQETQRLREHYDLRVIDPLPFVPAFLRASSKYPYHAAPSLEDMDGLEVHHPRHLVIPGMLRFTYGHLLHWGLAPSFRRLQRAAPADFVLAHYAFPDGYAALKLARRAGLPLLVKVRGTDVNVFTRTYLRRRLTLWTLRNADQVVAVSNALKQRMIEMGVDADRIAVVRNGVDRERFAPLDRAACRRELDLEPEPFIFLFVGILRRVKGIFTLLQAFRAIPEMQRRRARLILIGDGVLEGEILERVRCFGMAQQVRLVPAMPHAEIPRWIGACDCLVLPSHAEGYPNVLVEALACERPVVASRVGGVPEIVSEGRSGLMVPPSEPWPLTDAMTRMMTDFSFDASEAAAGRRDWGEVAAEMSTLIDDMLARHAGGQR